MARRTASTYADLASIALENAAFRLDDTPLTRYEMLREQQVTGQPVTKVAAKYGIKRGQFYFWKDRFEEFGLEGLFDRTPGPKGAIKATEEVEARVIELRRERDLNITDLEQVLKEEDGIDLSKGTINKILDKYGMPKKKRGRKPRTDGT